MKKVLRFLRSMKFGMILLVLILVCSLIGSFILQDKEAAYYAAEYPSWSGTLQWLGFDRIFSTWYFLALLILLGVNLIFCSILRFKNTVGAEKALFARADSCSETAASGTKLDQLEKSLKGRRYRLHEQNGYKVYYKNRSGFYGSFLTHLSLLLLFAFAATSMGLAETEDVFILPGESHVMADDTKIEVQDFRIEDAEGELDYTSTIVVTDAAGVASEPREISVNYPFSYGGHKYYQQSYSVAGSLTITYDGSSDTTYITEPSFISVDGTNGVYFQAVAPGYTTDENGQISLSDHGNYEDACYVVVTVENEEEKQGVVLPGTTVAVGDMQITFNDPVSYPGIRIKTVPAWSLGGLYASFVLMLVGLFLCFFHVPVYIRISRTGYKQLSHKISPEFNEMLQAAGLDKNDTAATKEE